MIGCWQMHESARRVIAESDQLKERGLGIRFPLPELGERVTGFVVRYEGKVYAYVNECKHLPVELDWNEGDFFDLDKQFLICATHGATYRPDNGLCVMGPCQGRVLQRLNVEEHEGKIMLYLNN